MESRPPVRRCPVIPKRVASISSPQQTRATATMGPTEERKPVSMGEEKTEIKRYDHEALLKRTMESKVEPLVPNGGDGKKEQPKKSEQEESGGMKAVPKKMVIPTRTTRRPSVTAATVEVDKKQMKARRPVVDVAEVSEESQTPEEKLRAAIGTFRYSIMHFPLHWAPCALNEQSLAERSSTLKTRQSIKHGMELNQYLDAHPYAEAWDLLPNGEQLGEATLYHVVEKREKRALNDQLIRLQVRSVHSRDS